MERGERIQRGKCWGKTDVMATAVTVDDVTKPNQTIKPTNQIKAEQNEWRILLRTSLKRGGGGGGGGE